MRVRGTVIDCPHQNVCREDEDKNRGRQRWPELSWSFRAFRAGTSERDEEKQVILVLRFVATSTQDIYTKDQNCRSGI